LVLKTSLRSFEGLALIGVDELTGQQILTVQRFAEIGIEPGLDRPDAEPLTVFGLIDVVIMRAAVEQCAARCGTIPVAK
jgi:hypothetical protein